MKSDSKNNDLTPRTRIPVVLTIDVLVVGAGSSAAAASLAAKERGASVMAISDRSYFGEESAGALELWPEDRPTDDSLFTSMFPDGDGAPATAGGIKRALETAMLRAQIPFWFLTRPVGLWHDVNGGLAGVILAFRTSLYAVRCRAVVDATREGLVFKLAGVKFPGRRSGDLPASLVTFVRELPENWSGRAQALKPGFSLKGRKGEDLEIESWRLDLGLVSASETPRERLASEHRLRAKLLDAQIQLVADQIPLPPLDTLEASSSGDDPLAMLADWNLGDLGLVPCNPTLPLSPSGVARLEQPATQLAMGRLAGKRAVDWLAGRPANDENGKRLADDQTISSGAIKGDTSREGTLGFASSFSRDNADEWLDFSWAGLPDFGTCDVVVAGGGTAGAPAAISAARAGASTVVLEMLHGLGGVGTMGMISSYWHGNRVGFTAESIQALDALDPSLAGTKNHSWNPELKSAWFLRTLLEANGEAWLRSFAFGVIKDEERVTGLLVSTPHGVGVLRAGTVIDASGNADVAAAAGAPCRVTDATHIGVQGSGLSARQPGVRERNSDHTFIDDCDVVGRNSCLRQRTRQVCGRVRRGCSRRHARTTTDRRRNRTLAAGLFGGTNVSRHDHHGSERLR